MLKSTLVARCGVCNIEFHTTPYNQKIGKDKFCSRFCTDKGRGLNSGMFKKGHKGYGEKDLSKWHIIVCPCGYNIHCRIKRTMEKKYCSRECWYRYRPKNPGHSEETKRKISLAHKKIHEGHPERAINWQGGISFIPGYKSLMKKKSRLNTKGSHTREEWDNLKRLYRFTCPACIRSEPEIKLTQDHIVPLIKGGNDYIENIQPLCGSCNTRKMVKTIKYENRYAAA